ARSIQQEKRRGRKSSERSTAVDARTTPSAWATAEFDNGSSARSDPAMSDHRSTISRRRTRTSIEKAEIERPTPPDAKAATYRMGGSQVAGEEQPPNPPQAA